MGPRIRRSLARNSNAVGPLTRRTTGLCQPPRRRPSCFDSQGPGTGSLEFLGLAIDFLQRRLSNGESACHGLLCDETVGTLHTERFEVFTRGPSVPRRDLHVCFPRIALSGDQEQANETGTWDVYLHPGVAGRDCLQHQEYSVLPGVLLVGSRAEFGTRCFQRGTKLTHSKTTGEDRELTFRPVYIDAAGNVGWSLLKELAHFPCARLISAPSKNHRGRCHCELLYDTGFALQNRVLSPVRAGSEQLFRSHVFQFWTHHSGRTYLPSAATVLVFNKDRSCFVWAVGRRKAATNTEGRSPEN